MRLGHGVVESLLHYWGAFVGCGPMADGAAPPAHKVAREPGSGGCGATLREVADAVCGGRALVPSGHLRALAVALTRSLGGLVRGPVPMDELRDDTAQSQPDAASDSRNSRMPFFAPFRRTSDDGGARRAFGAPAGIAPRCNASTRRGTDPGSPLAVAEPTRGQKKPHRTVGLCEGTPGGQYLALLSYRVFVKD